MTVNLLGYLGPSGTFSEEAALIYSRSVKSKLCEYSSIPAVINAVAVGVLKEGIVPIENTLEGGIAVTLDQLVSKQGIYIANELVHPVCQCLLVTGNILPEEIIQVVSHPYALGQCADYISRCLPNAGILPVESTAAAAKYIISREKIAAIASRRAAEIFKLHVLADGIQDAKDNATRFVVLSKSDHPRTGYDKTSLVFSIHDGPGSLYRVLGLFAERDLNLTRIESRPSRIVSGDWLFFVDCEGHRCDPGFAELWIKLKNTVSFIKLLGSYPVNTYFAKK